MKCGDRYFIGPAVFFIVCNLEDGHEGLHWDEVVGIDWLAHQPSGRLTRIGERCGELHPHYSAMSCGRKPGHNDAHSYGVPHVHEKWQLQESAKGGLYCAACGEDMDTQPSATELLTEALQGLANESQREVRREIEEGPMIETLDFKGYRSDPHYDNGGSPQ